MHGQKKVQWCQKHLQGVNITITTDKSLVYGRVLVDDYPDYIESWLNWRPRGKVIMPWSYQFHGYKREDVLIYDGHNIEEVRGVLQEAFDRE